MEENSSDFLDSMQETEEKQSVDEPDPTRDKAQEDQTEVKTSPQQNTSSHGNEGQADKTSPWPQHQHPRIEQYPGPRSAYEWPGTPQAPQRCPPHYKGAEPLKSPGDTPQPVQTLRGPTSQLLQMPPYPSSGGWNTEHGYYHCDNQYKYGYPQIGGPLHQFSHGIPGNVPLQYGFGTPGGAPPQYGYGTPGGVPLQYGDGTPCNVPPQYGYGTPGGVSPQYVYGTAGYVPPQYGYGTPHGVSPRFGHGAPPKQFAHGREESNTNQLPSKSEPSTTQHPGSNMKNPTKPKQVSLGKEGNHVKSKSGWKSPGTQTPKKAENRPNNRKDKVTPANHRSNDSKVEQNRPSANKPQEPGKMYVCVSGIGEDVSNETVINYLEARSKMDIVTDESLRREEDPDHAIVVFEDEIEVLKKACDSKRLKKCSLTFEELDPPRSVIFSSKDDKLTVDSLKRYLSGKHLETVRVHKTDEGSISVKMKNAKGVTGIMESTNIKIDRSNVVISVIYNCDHGQFWDQSLHRVTILVPYQRQVIMENVQDQVSTKNREIQEHLKRQNRIITESMHVKPIEAALMSREKKFEILDEIAPDFTNEVDKENGKITFTGVEEDISKAKVKIFEIKNNFYSWTIRNLSTGQCKLLANEQVSDKVYDKLGDDNIALVFEIGQRQIVVCITTRGNRKCVEKVFKEIVLEEEIKLNDTSKNVIVSDEWAAKKANLKKMYRNIADIDDSAEDKIVVIATCDVFDKIMDDLEQFIKEHSVYEETIKVKDEAEFRYLEMHGKNLVADLKFKNSDQGLEIEFVNQAIEISGTKKSIESAKSEVDCQIRKIKKDQHSITKPGADSFFNDKTKCADIIGPIEEESRTVILVDEASLTKSPFRRNTGRTETDEDYVRTQASKNYKRKGQGVLFAPPPVWNEQGTENFIVVNLINTSMEYKIVKNKLLNSVKNGQYTKTSPDVRGKTLTVTKIERIQNLSFYRMYAAKRALLEKQNPCHHKIEQELWHGCPESAVVSINLYGFNRSYCTVNSISRKGKKGEQLRVLPQRQDGTMLPYDANTDDLNPPHEFVVFNDTQAYPLYRIKYTLK